MNNYKYKAGDVVYVNPGGDRLTVDSVEFPYYNATNVELDINGPILIVDLEDWTVSEEIYNSPLFKALNEKV